MSLNKLIKSSSRAGRFKKKLVSEDELLREAPLIEARLAPLLKLFLEKTISEPELTALSIIATLSLRDPGSWLGSRACALNLIHKLPFRLSDLPWPLEENISRRLHKIDDLGSLLNNFALKSTPQAVNRTLLNWSSGNYQLQLYFTIPSAQEVLKMQVKGQRCVTVLCQSVQLRKYVLGERDPLSFTMHDLIHADHFYKDNDCYQGQLGFYGLLDHCLKEKHFEIQLRDEKFVSEFEYLISDMNAYAIHLMKCLKSALIHYHPQGEIYFNQWISQISQVPEAILALEMLNRPQYQPPIQDAYILRILERYKLAH